MREQVFVLLCDIKAGMLYVWQEGEPPALILSEAHPDRMGWIPAMLPCGKTIRINSGYIRTANVLSWG